MAGFSELIKSFDKTRDYVRDFLIYGFKVRNDFERKSARSYDDEKRRVESWLGDVLRYDRSDRGRQVAISVDSGKIGENPLYSAYYSKSFTDNDIRLHFFLTDILSGGEKLSLKELTDRLESDFGMIFEDQTVRYQLKEYVSEGIFLSEKRGKTAYFSLSHDTPESFFGEYEGLEDAVKFFSEDGVFGIAGNSLLRSAGLKNDLFLMKHSYIVHTLEDSVLSEITEAINEKRFISFRTFGAKNKLGSAELGAENQVIPFQIFSSVQTGRRYLAGYIPGFRRYNAFRLDFIRQAKKGDVCPGYDKYKEKFDKNMAKCFGVSFGMRRETGTVTPVKLTISFDEEKEPYILERLQREKRCGKLEKLSDGLYLLTVDAFDPNEVMHWAKTFIGRIVSAEGGSEAVMDQFYGDIKRMRSMYGKEK